MSKKAVITGITGQDGSYLAEYLIHLGYEVHGIIRRSSTPNFGRLSNMELDVHSPKDKLYLHYGDLTDSSHFTNLFYEIQPDEVYNLAAQSHVRISFDIPDYTGEVTGLATVKILEAIRRSKVNTRFYQASSSEMFGSSPPPQNEETRFHPRSPYGAAKVYSYWLTVNYRESYDLFGCNGILFNHESPRRALTFVTRKITTSIVKLLQNKIKTLYIGNLEAKRDWGYAPEYVIAMHKMLQVDKSDDFVIGTGTAHTVKYFLEKSFEYAGINLIWKGEGLEETGIIDSISITSHLKPGDEVVKIDPYYFRPAEVNFLMADISKARSILKWHPVVKLEDLIMIMMDFDMAKADLATQNKGSKLLESIDLSWTNNLYEEL